MDEFNFDDFDDVCAVYETADDECFDYDEEYQKFLDESYQKFLKELKK